jgi:hypothetical protein
MYLAFWQTYRKIFLRMNFFVIPILKSEPWIVTIEGVLINDPTKTAINPVGIAQCA